MFSHYPPKKLARSLFVAGAFLMSLTAPLFAEEADFQFFDEQEVMTASRRLQPIYESPVTIDVITEAEIKASGVINIWDLLRFRVGIDVMDARSSEGHRGLVSIRGFGENNNKSLLLLIDGRSVYLPSRGDIGWERLPVQIQDILRIEIVRGPNAALYGSNAGLGVINIITKRPGALTTFSAEGLVGNLSTRQGSVAFESSLTNFNYRLSLTSRFQNDFMQDPAGAPTNDQMFMNRANFRGIWNPAGRTQMELFSGVLGNVQEINISGTPFPSEGRFVGDFEMVRMMHQLGADSSLELMASRNFLGTNTGPTFTGERNDKQLQYDLEALHRFGWLDGRLQTTWGGSYRRATVESVQVFSGDPEQQNRLRRVFVSQNIKVADPLTLALAASLENSDTGGTERAYQGSILVHPFENHTFRLTYAMAPTIPSLFNKFTNFQESERRLFIGNADFEPEHLRLREIGYVGSYLGRRLHAEGNLFYTDRNNLETSFVSSRVGRLSIISFGAGNDAEARGAETKFEYRFTAGHAAYANYTYVKIRDTLGEKKMLLSTPKHKVNVGGIANLGHGLSASMNAGYKSSYGLFSTSRLTTTPIKPHWRLDARLAYSPSSNLEFFAAGQNLLDPRHKEFDEVIEVPRTYQGGMSVTF